MKDSTEKRLENLERELAQTKAELHQVKHRNLWLVGGGVLMAGLLALAWIFVDTAPPANAQGKATAHQEIQSKKFVLVNDRGRPCAALATVEDQTMLLFLDEKGKSGAMLNVNKLGSGWSLFDKKGRPRATLAVTEDGPMLGLDDEKGTTRVSLALQKHWLGLGLKDENGNIVRSFNISY